MDALKKLIAALDRFQQGQPWLAFPVAVWKKFGEDQAGNLAALIAYYGFASLFPLLLVLVTVLDIVLAHDPTLKAKVLDSAFGHFPVIGDQLQARRAGHTVSGTGVGPGHRDRADLPRRPRRGRGRAERAEHGVGRAVLPARGLPVVDAQADRPDPGRGHRPAGHHPAVRAGRRERQRARRGRGPDRHRGRLAAAEHRGVLARVPAGRGTRDQGPADAARGGAVRDRLADPPAVRHVPDRPPDVEELVGVRRVRRGPRPARLALPAGPVHPVRGGGERGQRAAAVAAQPGAAPVHPGGCPRLRRVRAASRNAARSRTSRPGSRERPVRSVTDHETPDSHETPEGNLKGRAPAP